MAAIQLSVDLDVNDGSASAATVGCMPVRLPSPTLTFVRHDGRRVTAFVDLEWEPLESRASIWNGMEAFWAGFEAFGRRHKAEIVPGGAVGWEGSNFPASTLIDSLDRRTTKRLFAAWWWKTSDEYPPFASIRGERVGLDLQRHRTAALFGPFEAVPPGDALTATLTRPLDVTPSIWARRVRQAAAFDASSMRLGGYDNLQPRLTLPNTLTRGALRIAGFDFS